jgi:hypothetical protein
MYFLALHTENARRNATERLRVETDGTTLRKWTLLPSDPASRDLLRLLALACCGHPFLPHLPFHHSALVRDPSMPLRLGFTLGCHAPRDVAPGAPAIAASVLEIDPVGRAICVPDSNGTSSAHAGVPGFKPSYGTGNSRFFSLAYGPRLRAHEGTDDFEFTDPHFRVSRLASLFTESARLTDPVQFLTRLHYRALLCSRFPARNTLQRLGTLCFEHLGVESKPWLEKSCSFRDVWRNIRSWQRRMMLPALDAARHVVDANPRSGTPLDEPGVILMDRPDRFCPDHAFASWSTFMDRLLPNMQFIVTLGEHALQQMPHALREENLPLPTASATHPRPQRRDRVRRGTILLVDVDSRLPNLALMKLSRHFKERGHNVTLVRKEAFFSAPEAVYASSVYCKRVSAERVDRLCRYYGDALEVGGSGVDLKKRLPADIEALPPDYDLYPELGDRAIGFLTRGCPSRCSFCLVPEKEGGIRKVSDLDQLLAGRKKLILLDDNILAHPDAGEMLEEMARRGLQVNFNQTLDLRRMSRELAKILKRIWCSNVRFTRTVYHFSLNNCRGLDHVRSAYRMLDLAPSDHVEFVCMYGYDTTLREDVKRFRFLRSLPGAYVFVQEYQPVLGGPVPRPVEFFDPHADDLIDELVTIVFTENMKSMEKYYRWLSKRYAQRFGALHPALVDTIFRYNGRDQKGRYMASMAGTRQVLPGTTVI